MSLKEQEHKNYQSDGVTILENRQWYNIHSESFRLTLTKIDRMSCDRARLCFYSEACRRKKRSIIETPLSSNQN